MAAASAWSSRSPYPAASDSSGSTRRARPASAKVYVTKPVPLVRGRPSARSP